MLSKKLIKHYRPCMGIMLFNPDGRIFMGRRLTGFEDIVPTPSARNDSYRWQMPQGGIDEGEDFQTAAFRELKEETGVTSARLMTISTGWLAYDFPPEYRKKNWKGQRQKWAMMVFTGSESEIDLEADAHQEFDGWRWTNLEDIPDLIVPFKRKVYEEVLVSAIPLRNYLTRSA